MFEILRALLGVNEACRAHGRHLNWRVVDDGDGPILKAEIVMSVDDVDVVNGLFALLGPVDTQESL